MRHYSKVPENSVIWNWAIEILKTTVPERFGFKLGISLSESYIENTTPYHISKQNNLSGFYIKYIQYFNVIFDGVKASILLKSTSIVTYYLHIIFYKHQASISKEEIVLLEAPAILSVFFLQVSVSETETYFCFQS